MKKFLSSRGDVWLTLLLMAIVTLAFAMRLLPHPANFTPVGAAIIFGAFYLPKRWAVAIPLIGLFLSDVIIGLYSPALMAAVYGGFLLIGLIALAVRKSKTPSVILGTTILGSILFFLITNAAVWVFSGMYPGTVEGLMQSYTLALPFFRNMLLGDLFFISLFVLVAEGATFSLKRRHFNNVTA